MQNKVNGALPEHFPKTLTKPDNGAFEHPEEISYLNYLGIWCVPIVNCSDQHMRTTPSAHLCPPPRARLPFSVLLQHGESQSRTCPHPRG